MHSKKLFFFDPQGAKKRSRSKRCVFGAKPPLTPFARTDRSAGPGGAVWGPPHSSGPRDWGLGIAKDHVWQRQWSRMVSARGGPMESYGRPPARLPTNQQMYSCVTAATWGTAGLGPALATGGCKSPTARTPLAPRLHPKCLRTGSTDGVHRLAPFCCTWTRAWYPRAVKGPPTGSSEPRRIPVWRSCTHPPTNLWGCPDGRTRDAENRAPMWPPCLLLACLLLAAC